MNRKSVLTTGEVAKHCAVHFRTVLRWIERGELRAYKLPGRGDNRIRIEDFLEFLMENKMPVPAEFQVNTNQVLVIEDEPEVVRNIQAALGRSGFEVVVASDGFRAGSYLKNYHPAVVTLDLQTSGLSGWEVLQQVRANQEFNAVKILVISNANDPELAQAVIAGADAVLPKPFTRDQFMGAVEGLMTQTEVSARAEVAVASV